MSNEITLQVAVTQIMSEVNAGQALIQHISEAEGLAHDCVSISAGGFENIEFFVDHDAEVSWSLVCTGKRELEDLPVDGFDYEELGDDRMVVSEILEDLRAALAPTVLRAADYS